MMMKVTSVGGLNISAGVEAMPDQHVRLCDPVTRDLFIMGHVTGMFEQVDEAYSSVAHC